jgi:hypothetical protein
LPNGAGRAGREGDQSVCRPDQDVLLPAVGDWFAVVRVAQVVHCVDQGLVVPFEFVHHFAKIIRCDGIEAEMHVKHVEFVAVIGYPARLEHQRRPPPAGDLSAIGRHRVGQSADSVTTCRVGEMADVDVRRRHRSHSQHDNPLSVDVRGSTCHAALRQPSGGLRQVPAITEVLRGLVPLVERQKPGNRVDFMTPATVSKCGSGVSERVYTQEPADYAGTVPT